MKCKTMSLFEFMDTFNIHFIGEGETPEGDAWVEIRMGLSRQTFLEVGKTRYEATYNAVEKAVKGHGWASHCFERVRDDCPK